MSKAFKDRFAGRVHRTRSDGTSVPTLGSNLSNSRVRPGAPGAHAAKARYVPPSCVWSPLCDHVIPCALQAVFGG